MNRSLFSTPHPGVNLALRELTARIQAILGGRFLGLYLYGSLALGDFDPCSSDIDLIVVTEAELPEDLFNALKEMHAQFDRGGSPWAGRVEAAYIPRRVLGRAGTPAGLHPQVEKGTALLRAPLETGWAFQRHVLREHGVLVVGRSLRGLVKPVSRDEMQQAAAVITGGWLEQARQEAAWIEWAHIRGSQAFIVLSLCRLLYSLETGKVASKSAAAGWALKKLGECWQALIGQALASQHDSRLTTEEQYEAMLDLLKYCAGQCKTAAPANG